MSLRRSLLVTALLVSVSAAADTPPPDAAAVAEAKKHFAAGEKLFDAGDLHGAVEELKEAYRLSRNPLLLYNIGVVYDKLDDAPLALHYFGKFIDEAKDEGKTHERILEAGQRAAELRKKLGAEEAPTPGEPAPTPAPAPSPPTLVHETIDQAPPGRPIDVTAGAPVEAGWTVTLYYRNAGEDLYQQVRMKPRPGLGAQLVARIPAAAVLGKSLHYYIAARDPEGKVIASSGKAGTPNVVYLDAAAPIHAYLQPGEEAAGPLPPPPPLVVAEPSVPRPATFYAKWATSGGAAVLLGVGIGFSLAARSYAETLEAEAIKSSSSECAPTPPPCRVFSQPRKDLQSTGQSYERWGNVALAAGAAAAIAAGILWYLDARETPTLVAGPGTLGAAASVSF
jgi:hypothetical protein